MADAADSRQLRVRVPLSHFWLRPQQHAFAEQGTLLAKYLCDVFSSIL